MPSQHTHSDGQCIHCTVKSCRHHLRDDDQCALRSIQVAPTPMADSGDPCDESMCSDYELR